MKKIITILILTQLYWFVNAANKNIQTTPYPETIEVSQIVSAEKEQIRLRHAQKKFDHQLTGFYVAADKQLIINVEVLTPAANNALPKIVIGTPSRAGNTRTEITLTTGSNTIPSTAHKGGSIYFRYVTDTDNPTGKVRISFSAGSQQVRVPHYIYGTTTASELTTMMDQYQTPDVMFSSADAVVVVSPEAATKYLLNGDKEAWMQTISNILLAEDQISGLDNADPNPLHRRLAPGVRHLFVEAGSGYMFATDFATGYYTDAALDRLLKPTTLANNNWGVAHELGHQHQQGAYKTGGLTETTVNIYTLAVQRFFLGSWYTRSNETAWNKLYTTYFTLGDTQRNYLTESITPAAANVNDARLFLFDQLHIIFGDAFYHRLHRLTREEHVSGGSDEERITYLVKKACQLTGYDLRDYFKKWGIVLSAYNQGVVDKAVTDANLSKPACNDQLYLTTPYFKPAGVPLPLIGISTSSPETGNATVDAAAAVAAYCDYSSKTGDFTDPRDNKVYPYKKYGNYDWFMKNLDWDGYNGTDDATRGSAGLYGTRDPDGSVYGRMYPTYAPSSAYATWCPTGWTTPTSTIWTTLMNDIKQQYTLTDTDLTPCLKCGGDQDEQADGVWAKGAGMINAAKAAQVGFNALPAGVFNKDAAKYDDTDKAGLKASFFMPSSAWFHKVIANSSDVIAYPNRNTRHQGSIRCVRASAPSAVNNVVAFRAFTYVDDSAQAHVVCDTRSMDVQFFNAAGKIQFATQHSDGHLLVNIANWPKGIYMVRVTVDKVAQVYKLVI